jgi:hypothetical protein
MIVFYLLNDLRIWHWTADSNLYLAIIGFRASLFECLVYCGSFIPEKDILDILDWNFEADALLWNWGVYNPRVRPQPQ